MKIVKDAKLGGIVQIADSIEDAVDYAKQVVNDPTYSGVCYDPAGSARNGHWHGRAFNGWKGIVESIRSQWDEGLKTIGDMSSEIRKTFINPPESLKRKFEWNEIDGEICVDRYLGNQPDYMRETRRKMSRTVNKGVTLLLNTGGNCSQSATDLFWRGAAAVTAIDMLEEAGYVCEVISWFRGRNTFYKSPFTENFWCCKLKSEEDPLNMDSFAVGVSPWFFRVVALACGIVAAGQGNWTRHMGQPTYPIGSWKQYIESGTGTLVEFPPQSFSKHSAINAAKSVIAEVTNSEPNIA